MPYVRLYTCINPKAKDRPTLSEMYYTCLPVSSSSLIFSVWPEPCMLHTIGGTSAQAVR
jgi:hypothetical protein